MIKSSFDYTASIFFFQLAAFGQATNAMAKLMTLDPHLLVQGFDKIVRWSIPNSTLPHRSHWRRHVGSKGVPKRGRLEPIISYLYITQTTVNKRVVPVICDHLV